MSAPMTPDREQEIRAALAAIPAPPWRWIGLRGSGGPQLVTDHSGRQYLLRAAKPSDHRGNELLDPETDAVVYGDLEFRDQREGERWSSMRSGNSLAVGRTEYDPDAIVGVANPVARWVERSAQHATDLLAEVDQLRARVAELEAPSPWERAVAGLNALVDADVALHVEPDGHISNPFGDEHIEWDHDTARWRLVHDDEEDSAHPPHPAPCRHPASPDCTCPNPLAYGLTGYRCGCGKDAHSNLTPCQPMTADEWNARYPVGTPVTAYPVTRDDEALTTVTRSRAWTLGHGAAVVSVEGYSGGICLTHVDPVPGAAS
ncbi:hypothetical protein [Streptomyces griseolus]|uniref:hypothetical protein n=1 Tax=Streptomyces griseolus TaxID=1909 RepID=UPI0022434F85|nr:hypothetical protein [Streptomyces griseolus]